MLRIGVVIPGEVGHPGELLADARALETAGAETLWLDIGAQDPWMLAAALSTVTSRARLGLELASPEDGATWAARARTLQRLTRGRAVLRADAGGLEAVVELAHALDGCRVFGQTDDEDEWARVARVADGLLVAGTTAEDDGSRLERAVALARDAGRPAPAELWVQVKIPEDRARWRHACATYGALGVTGLVVPHDARLVDLLRSDEDDDRSDLTLAQG